MPCKFETDIPRSNLHIQIKTMNDSTQLNDHNKQEYPPMHITGFNVSQIKELKARSSC